MNERPLDKALFGVLAGVFATMAMTATMRRLHAFLPEDERYPLPPREIVDSIGQPLDERRARSRALLSHFGFGGVTGAIFSLLPTRGLGVGYGLTVWVASYLGWIPAIRILSPAYCHPFRRNLLMVAAHVVWGMTLAKSLKEIEGAVTDVFAPSRGQPITKKERAERRYL